MSSTTDKKMTREQAQKIVDSMTYAEVLRMIAVLEVASMNTKQNTPASVEVKTGGSIYCLGSRLDDGHYNPVDFTVPASPDDQGRCVMVTTKGSFTVIGSVFDGEEEDLGTSLEK